MNSKTLTRELLVVDSIYQDDEGALERVKHEQEKKKDLKKIIASSETALSKKTSCIAKEDANTTIQNRLISYRPRVFSFHKVSIMN